MNLDERGSGSEQASPVGVLVGHAGLTPGGCVHPCPPFIDESAFLTEARSDAAGTGGHRAEGRPGAPGPTALVWPGRWEMRQEKFQIPADLKPLTRGFKS